jgi:hypothetical protein
VAITPPEVVNAPVSRGLRYGLFTAANGPLTLPEHGSAGGVTYRPLSCGFARSYPVECPADVEPTDKVFDPADPYVTAEPFVAYATYQCGSAGTSPAEMEARVRQRLANGEQSVAEQALGDILAADAVPLTGPDPTSIVATVADLEQWLYSSAGAGYGQVGFLHAPFRYNAYASINGLLVKDGKLLRTNLGTVWIFGDYIDDGTIYISGNVNVWRSEQVVVPPVEQTFDRSGNQYMALAERDYAVAYDCVAASSVFIPAGGVTAS